MTAEDNQPEWEPDIDAVHEAIIEQWYPSYRAFCKQVGKRATLKDFWNWYRD